MKIKLLSLFLILILTSFISAQLRVVLSNSQAAFDIKTGEPLDYFLTTTNKNNYPINITIQFQNKNHINITFKDPMQFSLNANESWNVSYTILVDYPGLYQLSIPVHYRGVNNTSFALQQTLRLNVTVEPLAQNVTTNKTTAVLDDYEDQPIEEIENNLEPIIVEENNNEETASLENNATESKDLGLFSGLTPEQLYTYLKIALAVFIVIVLIAIIWLSQKKKSPTPKDTEADKVSIPTEETDLLGGNYDHTTDDDK